MTKRMRSAMTTPMTDAIETGSEIENNLVDKMMNTKKGAKVTSRP